jgi:hypothetical protein
MGHPLHWLISQNALKLGALCALAVAAEVVPGVDSGGVAVFPVELKRVAADGGDGLGLGGGRVHGEKLRGCGFGLAGIETRGFAHVIAGGAGAGVAEPLESPRAFVSVGPVDLKAFALGEEDADFEGSDGFARELVGLFTAGFFFFADDADAFVTHDSILNGDARIHPSGFLEQVQQVGGFVGRTEIHAIPP